MAGKLAEHGFQWSPIREIPTLCKAVFPETSNHTARCLPGPESAHNSLAWLVKVGEQRVTLRHTCVGFILVRLIPQNTYGMAEVAVHRHMKQ